MREVTDATFAGVVLGAPLPVVVDFWAPWCAPCKAVEPIFEQLAAEHGSRVSFVRFNIDENPVQAARLEVLSLPTAILFEGGEARSTLAGAHRRGDYEREWRPWLEPRK